MLLPPRLLPPRLFATLATPLPKLFATLATPLPILFATLATPLPILFATLATPSPRLFATLVTPFSVLLSAVLTLLLSFLIFCCRLFIISAPGTPKGTRLFTGVFNLLLFIYLPNNRKGISKYWASVFQYAQKKREYSHPS